MPRLTAALALCLALPLGACRVVLEADPALLPDAGPALPPDAGFRPGLTLTGQVCSGGTGTVAFPVKVLFLVDQSGSMCLSDPPGAQAQPGFCDAIAQGWTDSGHPAEARRVTALRGLVAALALQASTEVAVLPYGMTAGDVYPLTTAGGPGFVAARDPALPTRIAALPQQLVAGFDLQGALGAARAQIEADVAATRAAGRQASLPRTRYVVVLLTDGMPYPRCSARDDLLPAQYASAVAPQGVWADDPPEFCNDPAQAAVLPGFAAGGDRNQNAQLFAQADQLRALASTAGLGGVQLSALLVTNEEALALCGPACTNDLLDGFSLAETRTAATWLLTQLTTLHGGGSFHLYDPAAPGSFDVVDRTSLASPLVKKALYGANLTALPTATGVEADLDGDAVSDAAEAAARTDARLPDTDLDGFPDALEIARAADGFDPLTPDRRGCRDGSGFTARFSCADEDGDGLSEAAEALLSTDPLLADSDRDGIPDGLEVLRGLDPLAPNLGDHDLDGLTDVEEIAAHLLPAVDDRARHAAAYLTRAQGTARGDGSTCYDFAVEGVELLPGVGANYLTVTFAQAPRDRAAEDYGLWRQACVLLVPPAVGDPAPVTLTDADFHELRLVAPAPGKALPDLSVCRRIGEE